MGGFREAATQPSSSSDQSDADEEKAQDDNSSQSREEENNAEQEQPSSSEADDENSPPLADRVDDLLQEAARQNNIEQRQPSESADETAGNQILESKRPAEDELDGGNAAKKPKVDDNNSSQSAGGNAGNQSSASKRPAEDELDGGNATKKAKLDDNDPCQQLATRLGDLKTRFKSALEGPVVAGEDMKLNVIFQALAAVTEAINDTRKSRGQSIIFSLFHPLSIAKNSGNDTPVVFPRHEALVPLLRASPNRIHYSLIILRQIGTERFAMDHLDSNRPLRASFARPSANEPTRQSIIKSGWVGKDGIDPDDLLEKIKTVNELSDHDAGSNWAVGIHVILNGWAYAFGWKLTSNAEVHRPDFYTRAAELINLAIRGQLDQTTILAFFNCYKYIQPGQTVATLEGKSFQSGTTTAFGTVDDLVQHVKASNGDIFRPAGAKVSRNNSLAGPARPKSRDDNNGDSGSPTRPAPKTRLDDMMNLNTQVNVQTQPEERSAAEEYLASITGEPIDETGSLDEARYYSDDGEDYGGYGGYDDDEGDEGGEETRKEKKKKEKRRKDGDDDENEEKEEEEEEETAAPIFDWRGRQIFPGQERPPSPPRNPFRQAPPPTSHPQQPSNREESVELDDPEDKALFGEESNDDDDDEDLYSGTFGPRRPNLQTQPTTSATPTLALPGLALPPVPPRQPGLALPSPASPLLPGIPQLQPAAPAATMRPETPVGEVQATGQDENNDRTTRSERQEAEQAYTRNEFGRDEQDDPEDVWNPNYGGNEDGNGNSTLLNDPEDDAQY